MRNSALGRKHTEEVKSFMSESLSWRRVKIILFLVKNILKKLLIYLKLLQLTEKNVLLPKGGVSTETPPFYIITLSVFIEPPFFYDTKTYQVYYLSFSKKQSPRAGK